MGIRHTKATDEHGHGYYPTQTWDSGAVLAVREFTCEDQAGDRPETRWTSAVYDLTDAAGREYVLRWHDRAYHAADDRRLAATFRTAVRTLGAEL